MGKYFRDLGRIALTISESCSHFFFQYSTVRALGLFPSHGRTKSLEFTIILNTPEARCFFLPLQSLSEVLKSSGSFFSALLAIHSFETPGGGSCSCNAQYLSLTALFPFARK